LARRSGAREHEESVAACYNAVANPEVREHQVERVKVHARLSAAGRQLTGIGVAGAVGVGLDLAHDQLDRADVRRWHEKHDDVDGQPPVRKHDRHPRNAEGRRRDDRRQIRSRAMAARTRRSFVACSAVSRSRIGPPF
jgi:hypothetical protein